MIASCIYGGRLDNRFDQRLLAYFVGKLFCQDSLNSSYPLIKDETSSLTISIPQDTTKSKYVEWVKQLPTNEKPTWLGLPDNAEKVLLISQGLISIERFYEVCSFFLQIGSKFAVDLLKCDQNDEGVPAIGKISDCCKKIE